MSRDGCVSRAFPQVAIPEAEAIWATKNVGRTRAMGRLFSSAMLPS
jgi:hypothetical protein